MAKALDDEGQMEWQQGQLVGPYKIVKLIGLGGMGEVYLAQDSRLGRHVALKFLSFAHDDDPDRRARFLNEARAASSLVSPNIAALYDIGEHEGCTFIVMEYVEGDLLADTLKSGPLPASRAVDIGLQVAAALEEAHSKGVVHRDIKSSNLMITSRGVVKVLDFGIAKIVRAPEVGSGDDLTAVGQETTAGMLIGTVAYMSPEQVRCMKIYARTDIFSLGVVLYEMLSGKLPFTGDTLSDLIVSVLEREPPPLLRFSPGLLPDLDRVVRRAIEKDRNARYSTIGDFRSDLESVKQELQSNTPAHRRIGRKRVAATIAVLLFIGLLLFAYSQHGLTPRMEQTTSETTTLAVLPFHVVNAPQDAAFMGVGVADAIITRLSNVRRMRIRPTTAVLRYEKETVDSQQAGLALKAEYVLSGIVSSAGENVRASVQLVRVRDGVSIWGQKYDLVRQDLFQLQDSIAQKVSTALHIQMTVNERERVYRRYTNNTAAYELYLRGRSYLARATMEDTRASVKTFEDALRLDSKYALARAGLVMASAEMHLRFASGAEAERWGQRAEQEARQALEEEPNLAETHQALAAVYARTEFDWEKTIQESQRALELNPSLEWPRYYIAGAFNHLGLLDASEREIALGMENNPESRLEGLRLKGVVTLLSGRSQESIVLSEEVDRLSRDPRTEWNLAQAYFYAGDKSRAEDMLEKLSQSSSGSASSRARATLASIQAARGARKEAAELLAALEKRPADHHVAYSIGAAYAQLGEAAQAVQWLRKSAHSGFPCYPRFEADPMLQPLKNNPEFERLLAELRSAWDTARNRYIR